MNRRSIVGTHSVVAVLAALGALSGCGLAETGAAAATQGAGAAEQAKQAEEIQDDVKKRLDDAQRVAADRIETAESAE
jgi:hypothetical protein